jgi:hypothetical protein
MKYLFLNQFQNIVALAIHHRKLKPKENHSLTFTIQSEIIDETLLFQQWSTLKKKGK